MDLVLIIAIAAIVSLTIVLTILSVFFYRKAWPFITEQIKRNQVEMTRTREQFIITINRTTHTTEQTVTAIRALADAVEGFRTAAIQERKRP